MANFKNTFDSFLTFRYIKNDLPAGFVVFLVALPLSLGIAHATGAPLLAGLITSMVGGLLVSILSGSQLAVSGPAAGLSLIVFAATGNLGYENFLVAVVLAGILQVILGLLKAGSIGNYFPSSVIKGMLSAIGILLILKQIPHVLGDDVDYIGDFTFFQVNRENTFTEIINAIKNFHVGAILICVVSLLIMFLWSRPAYKKLTIIPGPLVAVIVSMLLSYLFYGWSDNFSLTAEHMVEMPLFDAGSFAANFSFPDFGALGNPTVYIVAFTIAIVGSIESLLSVEAIDKLDPLRRNTPANRELIAQGIGNTLSGLIGGLPMAVVIVRGAGNVISGARSKAASFFHGCFLLLAVFFLAKYVNLIPLSCLAAILLVIGYKLIKISMFREVYKKGWEQFIPFAVTILAIVFTDLLIGIGIGLATAAIFILRRNLQNPYFMSRKEYDHGQKVKIVLAEEVSFLNKASVQSSLESIPPDSDVLIDASRSKYIDGDILEIINDFKFTAPFKNIRLELKGLEKETEVIEPKALKKQRQQEYQKLFTNNRIWVEGKLGKDPDYFRRLAEGQSPKYLFIGCSDSRIHPNEITGTDPGEMFIHRNIANMVVHTDTNLMSVLQYSVEILKVQHIIVCGHYGCGGVRASCDGSYHGLIDKWLRNIKDVYRLHRNTLDAIKDAEERHMKLVELNVKEQVFHLCMTSAVQKARNDGLLQVHGWVYDIHEGYIIDLDIDVERDFKDFGLYEFKDLTPAALTMEKS